VVQREAPSTAVAAKLVEQQRAVQGTQRIESDRLAARPLLCSDEVPAHTRSFATRTRRFGETRRTVGHAGNELQLAARGRR
jgi:hypothetical protein